MGVKGFDCDESTANAVEEEQEPRSNRGTSTLTVAGQRIITGGLAMFKYKPGVCKNCQNPFEMLPKQNFTTCPSCGNRKVIH
jgi:DNA-directed RNA polymerase subunit RPC12/RpoP